MVQTITVHATTRTPADVLYALLKDPTTWTAWSPMAESGPLSPGVNDVNGVGSTRGFRNGRVRGIDQVVELIPGRRFSYVHVHGLPVRDYRADVDLTETAEGTSIQWRATFKPKVAGTGWIWRIGLRRFLQQVVDGLASYQPAGAATEPAGAT